MEKSNPSLESEKSSQKTSNDMVFSNDIFFAHNRTELILLKRTERLVSAIYLITNLIKDNDPFKWDFRTSGMRACAQAGHLLSAGESVTESEVKKVAAIFYEILSYLEIGSVSGLISEMNASILKKESSNLLEFLRSEVYEPLFIRGKNMHTQIQETLAIDEYLAMFGNSHEKHGSFSKGQSHKGHIKDIKDNAGVAKQSLMESSEGLIDISRKDALISLLKKMPDPASIKEISIALEKIQINAGGGIGPVSEKTLQRELLALVESGTLRKVGERRWSRYTLAG